MKLIRIDFGPPSVGRALWRVSRRTGIVIVAGLLLCGGGAYTAMDLLEQRASARQQAQALIAKQQARSAPKPVPKKMTIPDAQATAINGAVAQLNLPWRDVLDAIEASTPTTIALLSVEPDGKKSLVKGVAEAKSSDAMIAYVEQLKQQEFFRSVVLIRHEIHEQDANKPLRFQFEASWMEGTQ